MRFSHSRAVRYAPGRNRTCGTFPPGEGVTRQVGDKIPGRLACVMRYRIEERHGREFVVYELTDSLRKPEGKSPMERAD